MTTKKSFIKVTLDLLIQLLLGGPSNKKSIFCVWDLNLWRSLTFKLSKMTQKPTGGLTNFVSILKPFFYSFVSMRKCPSSRSGLKLVAANNIYFSNRDNIGQCSRHRGRTINS
jgi:hypothetical protein